MQKLKYLAVNLLPLSSIIAFTSTGVLTLLPVFVFFVALPFLELFLPLDNSNFDKKTAMDEKHKKLYDWMLYLAVPFQLACLGYFLFIMQNTSFGSLEFYGRVLAMGIMCGVLGINVGHELGHRHNRTEQFLGEVLLLTSLNTHFLPYHNGGHHLNVATPKDPATASKNQLLYTFWFKSHFKGYQQAWTLENNRMQHTEQSIYSLNNRMVTYTIANILLVSSIYFLFNYYVLLVFITAAILGIGLLETINYIEHYGLTRSKDEKGRYEPVRHHHSWDSNHVLGRAVLFNLSRHADHHFNGSKKYQILNSIPASPQMPTGYPGMVVLAFFQPLWFLVMNKKLEEFNP
ncbi:MAG: alkane 1-monooxygenase [Saprospiraceae bacterium]